MVGSYGRDPLQGSIGTEIAMHVVRVPWKREELDTFRDIDPEGMPRSQSQEEERSGLADPHGEYETTAWLIRELMNRDSS